MNNVFKKNRYFVLASLYWKPHTLDQRGKMPTSVQFPEMGLSHLPFFLLYLDVGQRRWPSYRST